MPKKFLALVLALGLPASAFARSYLLVPMDKSQTDHLRAYGVAFYALSQSFNVEWLLNFRGGSFLVPDSKLVEVQARLTGVSFERVDDSGKEQILATIKENNMEDVLLEKAPRIAVYTPPDKRPWDDAVTLALTYAGIKYETIWDKDVLEGKLHEYDWVHLHHEDFSGQFGKFYATFHNAPWYIQQVKEYNQAAKEAGYEKVWQHKHAVARALRDYVQEGGFLFAMCSATDSIDVALAAEDVDIVGPEIDGDGIDPGYAQKLDFTKTFAFKNFELETSPYVYEYANIDVSDYRNVSHPELENFSLFEFSAKIDTVATMLTQCHVNEVKGFFGQTTSFAKPVLKENLQILGEMPGQNRVKYIHGQAGKGTFTFLGGHDPEDFSHAVGDPPTDLGLHKNSPGYRLILNNVLFPAARKKELKT
ncbi:MAG: asparagine synthetase B [Candidatus Wallbacteria bacterium]|nr:asparagine synthetase B [Candidatus Wallbacteria bacterium]